MSYSVHNSGKTLKYSCGQLFDTNFTDMKMHRCPKCQTGYKLQPEGFILKYKKVEIKNPIKLVKPNSDLLECQQITFAVDSEG